MTQKKSAAQQPTVCHGHTRPVVDVQYSHQTADGYFLATAAKDSEPMLRFGETGDWYGTFVGHKGAVWSCMLNKPALLYASASADFTARVWNACSGEQLHEFQHQHVVRCTAFSDGNLLATGGMEKLLRVYDLDKPEADPLKSEKQAASMRCLTWLDNDKLLLCSYTDKSGIGVFDTRTLQQVRTLETASPVLSMEVSFDGQHLTTAEGSVVRFWDAATLTQVKSHNLRQPNAESASYCPEKGIFVTGGADMWVRMFDYDSSKELQCNKGHHGPVHAIRFSPTYDAYASGSEDGTIRIWHCQTSDTGVMRANGNH